MDSLLGYCHIDMEAIKKIYGDLTVLSAFSVSPNDFSIIPPHLHCHSARPIGMGYHIDVTKLGLQQNTGVHNPGTVTKAQLCLLIMLHTFYALMYNRYKGRMSMSTP